MSMHPGDRDAGDDASDWDSGPDAQRLDLPIEVDCPDCNGTCGDGVLKTGEQCDDGNQTSGDGCNLLCQISSGWTCPVPGRPCQRSADQDAALD